MHIDKESRFFSYSAVPQAVIDPASNRLVAGNQELSRLLGLSRQELEGLRASNLFGDQLPGLITFTQELINRGRAWTDALSILIHGEPVAVEISGRCIRAGEEAHLYLALQRTDELDGHRSLSDAQRHYQSGIGHWNRVARVFQEFERENRLLLEAAGEGIYGVDAEGLTTFANPAAERILGYSADEMIGRNMHTMVHHSHRDGSHFPAEHCPIFSAFRLGTVQTIADDVFWNRAGDPVDVEYTSTPIRDDGVLVGAVVIFRDVSQRKADHRRLLAALDEVESLKHRLEMENAYLQEELSQELSHHRILGHSPAMQRLNQQIDMVAPTNATVLIHGESGTGKELIARSIHEASQRSNRPLIRVNCAAIPEELFESEFFGHAKGAFTGAVNDRMGRFELADGGTLFLDEVGEIPLHLQSKLLRVLQEQQFERVGDPQTRNVDVRILAATNQDLKQRVEEGLFREDLFFRLNVFPIESVPLRERLEDIPVLTQHFTQKICLRSNRQPPRIPLAEIEKLRRYHWPGNVRELENVVERQIILSRGETLRFDTANLDSPVRELQSETALPSKPGLLPAPEGLSDLKTRERELVRRALEQSKGKVSGPGGAAECLGLKPTTLSSRLKKLQLDPRDFR